MRLIDGDALKDLLQSLAYDDWNQGVSASWADAYRKCADIVDEQPTIETEQHYCEECKWSRCYINVDKHGKSETYWRCLNWDDGTDGEGFCYKWEGEQK